jgi:hypothetical protein
VRLHKDSSSTRRDATRRDAGCDRTRVHRRVRDPVTKPRVCSRQQPGPCKDPWPILAAEPGRRIRAWHFARTHRASPATRSNARRTGSCDNFCSPDELPLWMSDPLTEGFFLDSAEVDWCRRFRLSGREVLHVPQRSVIHHGGMTQQPTLVAHLAWSSLRCARRICVAASGSHFRAAIVSQVCTSHRPPFAPAAVLRAC